MTDPGSLPLLFDYQSDPERRGAFHRFAEEVFQGISFRAWDALGGWSERYRVASVFDGDRVVSNVSISHLDLLVRGKPVRAAQLATVGTIPGYRHRGLSARLMRGWLADLTRTTELQFLFANDTVLDFYPKFGFRRVQEHVFRARVDWPALPRHVLRSIDLGDEAQRRTLFSLVERRAPLSRTFGCVDYGFVLLFHLLHGMAEHVHWIEDRDAVVIAELREGTLHVYEIVAAAPVAAGEILPSLASTRIEAVVFHFTPDEIDLADLGIVEPIPSEDPFFVRGSFPLEGDTFKFPALAQT